MGARMWSFSESIWVCLKIGYIPNEIAIFHRDNDQQNHWVQWGTQHFQTHTFDSLFLLVGWVKVPVFERILKGPTTSEMWKQVEPLRTPNYFITFWGRRWKGTCSSYYLLRSPQITAHNQPESGSKRKSKAHEFHSFERTMMHEPWVSHFCVARPAKMKPNLRWPLGHATEN